MRKRNKEKKYTVKTRVVGIGKNAKVTKEKISEGK